jgi:putative oxidoreductase
MKFGRTLARVVIGGLFIGHGTQKLFGWFGGHGLEGTAGFFESIGLRPGKRNAMAAGISEAAGGAALATGAATPLAAAALIGTMITAVRTVHLKNGVWITDGGFEYNLVLVAALLVLIDEEHGPGWALGALAAGAAGSTAVVLLAEDAPAEPAVETVQEQEPAQEAATPEAPASA